jgi:hypothetical protein
LLGDLYSGDEWLVAMTFPPANKLLLSGGVNVKKPIQIKHGFMREQSRAKACMRGGIDRINE